MPKLEPSTTPELFHVKTSIAPAEWFRRSTECDQFDSNDDGTNVLIWKFETGQGVTQAAKSEPDAWGAEPELFQAGELGDYQSVMSEDERNVIKDY